MIKAIWAISTFLMPLTHTRTTSKTWLPRPWALRLHVASHPWLWCSCGDSLGTWKEVRWGKCITCQQMEESEP